jgi:hypothetical protein
MGEETQAPLQKSAFWADHFSQRERDQIRACLAYHSQHETAGLPGHGLMLLVSKLSTMLDDATDRFGYTPLGGDS